MMNKERIQKALDFLALHEEAKRRAAEKKEAIKAAQKIKDNMSVSQKIKMLNTPYAKLSKNLQPGMVQHPQKCNFIRIRNNGLGHQRETFSARLVRYCDKYRLTPERFCEICNEYARRFDMPATLKHPAQRTRITMRDLNGYLNNNVCPKIDKMMIIAGATEMPIEYFAGYGPNSIGSDVPPLQIA